MFVILTYDIQAKCLSKVLKICRKYMFHVQKSVFEGELTERKLNKLKGELKRVIDYRYDNVCIYKSSSAKYTTKEIIGPRKMESNII